MQGAAVRNCKQGEHAVCWVRTCRQGEDMYRVGMLASTCRQEKEP